MWTVKEAEDYWKDVVDNRNKEIRHLQGVIDIALRNLEKGRVYQATNILRKANEEADE